jgi:hypothetical protein
MCPPPLCAPLPHDGPEGVRPAARSGGHPSARQTVHAKPCSYGCAPHLRAALDRLGHPRARKGQHQLLERLVRQLARRAAGPYSLQQLPHARRDQRARPLACGAWVPDRTCILGAVMRFACGVTALLAHGRVRWPAGCQDARPSIHPGAGADARAQGSRTQLPGAAAHSKLQRKEGHGAPGQGFPKLLPRPSLDHSKETLPEASSAPGRRSRARTSARRRQSATPGSAARPPARLRTARRRTARRA